MKTMTGGRAQSIGRRGKVEQVRSASAPSGGGVGIGGDGEHSRQGEATTQNSLHILKREPWLKAVSIPGQTVIVLPQEIL